MEIKDYLKKWCERLSLTEEDIMREFNIKVEEEKTLHPKSTEEELNSRATQRLSLTYKKQLKSPAVGFDGMVIAVGDCIDMMRKQRAEATKAFDTNPQDAIAKGLTNSEGTPLVTRKEWGDGKANKDYGKPLPAHSYMRNIVGVAIKPGEGATPKSFYMGIRGAKAQSINIPMFTPLKFRAIDKSQADSENFALNSSTFTEFIPDKNLILPKPEELITKYFGEFMALKDLPSHHETNKDNYNRIAIIQGDVSTLNLEPTSAGSRIMVIEDTANLEDLESPGTTCWIPEHIKIDFGEQSKVIALGRTARGFKRDDQGNSTEELGDVTINVMGIYAIPEYKIAPIVEEITEENTTITGTSELNTPTPPTPEAAW